MPSDSSGAAIERELHEDAAHERDMQRWRSCYALMSQQAAADPAFHALWRQLDALGAIRNTEARDIVAQAARPLDIHRLGESLTEWASRPGPYTSMAPLMRNWWPRVLAQPSVENGQLQETLARVIVTPTTTDEAATSIALLEEAIGAGGPDLSLAVTFLSVLWVTDNDAAWPVLWPGGADIFATLGWMGRHLTHAERYVAFVHLCQELATAADGHSPTTVARVVWHQHENPAFCGIGSGVLQMCREAVEVHGTFTPATGYLTGEDEARAASLALQLRGHAAVVARDLHPKLEEAAGEKLAETSLAARNDSSARASYRSDSHSTWLLPASSGGAPSLRLWVCSAGVGFGLLSGWDPTGEAARHEELGSRLEQRLPNGVELLRVAAPGNADRLQAAGRDYPGGEVFVGRFWPGTSALDRADLQADILELTKTLLPLANVMRGVDQWNDGADAELAGLLSDFLSERPYPVQRDQWHRDQRKSFAASLEPDALAAFDLDTFKRIIASRAYGATGTHSVMDARLAAFDARGLEALARTVHTLLWGDGDDADRIDAAIAHDDADTIALDEAVAMKLLALAHPHRYLPVYPLAGRDGKFACAQALGVVLPRRRDLSRGRLHVLANDRLRSTLEPLLPGDPWGQVQFALWLQRKRETAVDPDRDLVAEASAELLVDEAFLKQIDALLQEKKQVIFYGPPGTGKTYLAQRFAAALQPDASKRAIVQFHPSTSYEDFFEGYRPRLDASGAMVYELRRGPLALLAEAAEADPTSPHVMIIDEINRANLPRVFGELLFLLEYRSQSVVTNYRPDEGFQLPPNLFFIGTMNTADRSIALVDAALRRRFHFIPFMPHEGPMEGLLERWLRQHDGPVWVAGLVDRVNEELRHILRGPHLQIGHSHFMARDLSDEALGRIWAYSIYPFVEDQLYGREDVLASFTWDAVLARHGGAARQDVADREVADSGILDRLDLPTGGPRAR